MVKYKRTINSDTERYGGFSEIEVKAPQSSIEIGDSFSQSEQKRAEQKQQAEQAFSYTTMQPNMQRDFQPDRVQQYSAPAAAPTPDQIMPTIRTPKDNSVSEVENSEETASVQKIDGRTKAILGVYLAIIVLLSALVIATGIFLTSAGSRVEALENELSAKNAFYSEQLTEIANLSDEEAITDRALNRGMRKINSSEDIDLLPMEDAPTYEGTTNWFDSFCDWLSGVLGG